MNVKAIKNVILLTSMFLIAGAFVGVSGNYDAVEAFKNSLSYIPGPVLDVIKLADPNFETIFTSTIKCLEETFNQASVCNFNTSVDVFVYLKECAKNTTFDKFLESLEKVIPKVDAPVGVPEYRAQSRCFDPAAFLGSPPDLSSLNPSVL